MPRLYLLSVEGDTLEHDEKRYLQQAKRIHDFFKSPSKDAYIYYLHHSRLIGKFFLKKFMARSWSPEVAKLIIIGTGYVSLVIFLIFTRQIPWRFLTSGILFCLSPTLIWYDVSLYSFTFPLLCLVISVYLYLYSLNATQKPRHYEFPAVFLSGLFLGCAIMANNTALILMPAFLVLELLFYRANCPALDRILFRLFFGSSGLVLIPLWMSILSGISDFHNPGLNILHGDSQLSGLVITANQFRAASIEASQYPRQYMGCFRALYGMEGLFSLGLALAGCMIVIKRIQLNNPRTYRDLMMVLWFLIGLAIWNSPLFPFYTRHQYFIIIPFIWFLAEGLCGAIEMLRRHPKWPAGNTSRAYLLWGIFWVYYGFQSLYFIFRHSHLKDIEHLF